MIRDAPKSIRKWRTRVSRKTEAENESRMKKRIVQAAAAVGAAGVLAGIGGLAQRWRRQRQSRTVWSRLHLKT
jgi:hypothetical protein